MGFFSRKKGKDEPGLDWQEDISFVSETTERTEHEIIKKFEEVFEWFPRPANRVKYVNLTSTYTMPIWRNLAASKLSCWIQDNIIYFLSDMKGIVTTQENTSKRLYPGFRAQILAVQIPLKQVLCFGIYHQVQSESGYFASMGYHLQNATLGGIFSEMEGTMYLSKKVQEEMAPTSKIIEERKTVLYYIDEHNLLSYLPFNPVDYYTFQQMIPSKELKEILANRVEVKEVPGGVDRLRQLRDMYDLDLITEEEFKVKRQEILNQL